MKEKEYIHTHTHTHTHKLLSSPRVFVFMGAKMVQCFEHSLLKLSILKESAGMGPIDWTQRGLNVNQKRSKWGKWPHGNTGELVARAKEEVFGQSQGMGSEGRS